jgi:hypothetical protein
VTTYSAILDIPRDTIAFLVSLLLQHRQAIGTRARRRVLSVGKRPSSCCAGSWTTPA